MKTLIELFEEQASVHPGRVAVHHRGRDVTYEELAADSHSFAAWLRREGLHWGERVAVLLPNSPEYVACYLGVLRAGGIVVALNPETTISELQYTLKDATPTVAVTGGKAADVLAEAAREVESLRLIVSVDGPSPPSSLPGGEGRRVDREVEVREVERRQEELAGHQEVVPWSDVLRVPDSVPMEKPALDDLAQIIYTSGTTGRPKGVTLSHRNIAANCRSILGYLELTAEDSVFVILPFFYSYGNSLLFTHLAVGGRLILASDFVFWNRALDLMTEQRATGFSGVPSSYAMLLHKSDFRKRRFPHLRYLTCAGGGLAPSVVEQLREIVPGVRLFPMYGQTEATARLSTLMPDELDAKPGSIGRGIPGVTLHVVDDSGRPVTPGEVGEIVARGENIMMGYWNDPEETRRVLRPEGLRTGDLARVDEDGYLYIVGRKSDMIKSGSYRINPQEIEEIILEVSGVAEVAVLGLPDEIWGESPVALIVPSTTDVAPTPRAILEHCRGRLPRYKLIRDVRFVDSLPKTSSGKVKRSELRQSLQAVSSDAVG